MTSGPKLHKAGPLTVALLYSNLRGDPSGDSDYATDTQHDGSDSSSDCGSNTSGDEHIIAEGHAAEARAAEVCTAKACTAKAHAAEARAAEVHAAEAHAAEVHAAEARTAKVRTAEARAAKALAADSEECSDKEEAAEEEEGPRVSDEGCTSPFYDKCPLSNSPCAQGRIFH
jgi:hypothetical protein